MSSFRQGLDLFIRWATGALFIFSGLIKLNDPIGTQIKLEEYFEVFATDFAGIFHYFIPFALPIGMFLIILEVILGIALFINYRMEISTKILLGLILFFTALTFYSAFTGKVTDCGCFGDAIPLTPWQSFYKDLVLTVFIVHLFWYRKTYQEIVSRKVGNIIAISFTVICFILGVYAIEHLPYIDFRPYKIGDNIEQNMIPEEQPIFEYTFVKDGEEVKSVKFLLESDGYEMTGYEIINEDKTTPKITDYNVWNPESGDFTAQTFVGLKLMLIVVDVDKANTDYMANMNELFDQIDGKIDVIALTSSDPSKFEPFRHEHQLGMPYYFSDATVLKAIIRSNPGLILVKDGTVMGKWHYNDTPDGVGLLDALSN